MAMQDNDLNPGDLRVCHLGHPVSNVPVVGVPPHSGDRSNGLKLSQDAQWADVARVKDVLHLGKVLPHLGPEEAVGVRYQPDLHASLEALGTGGRFRSPLFQRVPTLCGTPR